MPERHQADVKRGVGRTLPMIMLAKDFGDIPNILAAIVRIAVPLEYRRQDRISSRHRARHLAEGDVLHVLIDGRARRTLGGGDGLRVSMLLSWDRSGHGPTVSCAPWRGSGPITFSGRRTVSDIQTTFSGPTNIGEPVSCQRGPPRWTISAPARLRPRADHPVGQLVHPCRQVDGTLALTPGPHCVFSACRATRVIRSG